MVYRVFQVVKAKDRALQDMLQEGDVPLRDGVAKLIDDALAADARVGLLCGTMSQQVCHTISLILTAASPCHAHVRSISVHLSCLHPSGVCCRRRMLAARFPLR
jgi:hypothetical protein